MRIVVTGAAGFIGSRVCQHLEEAGNDVIRLIHKADKTTEPASSYVIDITDNSTFAQIEKESGIDALVHCAAIAHRFGKTSGSEFASVNVEGSRNIADLASRMQIPKVIHLSSVLVYGEVDTMEAIDESFPIQPADDYARSKAEAEAIMSDVCLRSGIDLVILRPAPVVGEGSRGNTARLIEAIKRKRFFWIGDGRNRRSFVYVGDVARAVEYAINLHGEVAAYNVVGGCISIRELVGSIASECGVRVPTWGIPLTFSRLAVVLSRPLSVVPPIGRLNRTAKAWLSNAVYSGESLRRTGFFPQTNVEAAIKKEIGHNSSSTT